MPRPTPSPPSSAHQRHQPSHQCQTCHGNQTPTLATSEPPPKSNLITNNPHYSVATPPPMLLPPNSSGPTSAPPKPSVDGAPSPPRSSATETCGVSPLVPSGTPVTPTRTPSPPSGTTSGHADQHSSLPQSPPLLATPPTRNSPLVVQPGPQPRLLQLPTSLSWSASSLYGVLLIPYHQLQPPPQSMHGLIAPL